MHFDEIVEQTIERYAQMAQLDGWKHYVWGEIKRLNDAPHWSGKNVKERFLNRVKSIRDESEKECGLQPNRESNSQGTS